MDTSPPSDGRGAADEKQKPAGQNRVRRRNRMITSCLECRRRKLNKFSRDCLFLAPALDSVSQQRLNEIKEKMGSLERVLEQDVARKEGRVATSSSQSSERRTSADLPGGEDSSSDNEAAVPDDEKGLEPTPLAVIDAAYEDDANDDVLDLGIRIGKMR
ncbi:putative fungal specific transcription factor domain-containing protein [Fonsecaea pedrosoi]|nr:putative fungal specific transcription factor domain-containing protein [Fonsecaea pedrosoi]